MRKYYDLKIEYDIYEKYYIYGWVLFGAMNTEKVRLKVHLPDKFTGGTKDNFEDFEKRLRTYLCLTDTRFAVLLKWALGEDKPITEESIALKINDQAQTDYALMQMQPFLYYTLQTVIEGGAQLVIEQVSEENGLEASDGLNLQPS